MYHDLLASLCLGLLIICSNVKSSALHSLLLEECSAGGTVNLSHFRRIRLVGSPLRHSP